MLSSLFHQHIKQLPDPIFGLTTICSGGMLISQTLWRFEKEPDLRYLSVCSGIEAASAAWKELGWSPVAFCETAPFPSKVLAARFGSNLPHEAHTTVGVPNLGDFMSIDTSKLEKIDVLVGGTPCQPFSPTGQRLGLKDERGQLALKFADLSHELARHNGLRFAVWENVPGVLSKREDFGRILGNFVGSDAPLDIPKRCKKWPNAGMAAGDWARVAWRVLDSQYFGLPQRRKRLLVVVGFGVDTDPAEILFEPKSMQGRDQSCQQEGKDLSGVPDHRAGGGQGAGLVGTGRLICFDPRKSDPLVYGDITGPLDCGFPGPAIAYPTSGDTCGSWSVRRLLPVESEAAQGLPAAWTDIPSATDSQRYKAIGNSMSVNVMAWLGQRLKEHEYKRLPAGGNFRCFCNHFSFVL